MLAGWLSHTVPPKRIPREIPCLFLKQRSVTVGDKQSSNSEEWQQLLQSNSMDAEMENWQVDIYSDSDVNLGSCHNIFGVSPSVVGLLLFFLVEILISKLQRQVVSDLPIIWPHRGLTVSEFVQQPEVLGTLALLERYLLPLLKMFCLFLKWHKYVQVTVTPPED